MSCPDFFFWSGALFPLTSCPRPLADPFTSPTRSAQRMEWNALLRTCSYISTASHSAWQPGLVSLCAICCGFPFAGRIFVFEDSVVTDMARTRRHASHDKVLRARWALFGSARQSMRTSMDAIRGKKSGVSKATLYTKHWRDKDSLPWNFCPIMQDSTQSPRLFTYPGIFARFVVDALDLPSPPSPERHELENSRSTPHVIALCREPTAVSASSGARACDFVIFRKPRLKNLSKRG